MENNIFLWHYTTLSNISKEIYTDVLNHNCIQEEIALKEDKDTPSCFFWLISKNKVKYVLEADKIMDLPIKVVNTQKVSAGQKVFQQIIKYIPIKVKAEKHFSFKELINLILPLKHSSPEDFTLYKVIGLAAYCDRINCRVASDMGFGKDSFFNVLNALRNDVSVVTPVSTASLEYRLTNKVVVLNETSNLDGTQKGIMQQALLRIGDFSNSYEKSTRGSSSYGTQDIYDISRLSLMVVYNNLDYYETVGQGDKFFDRMFTAAVRDRFFPVKLQGQADIGDFNNKREMAVLDLNKLALDNKEFYLRIIRTIEWYKQNYNSEIKQFDDDTTIKGRQGQTFEVIKLFLNLYSDTQEEYNKWVELLALRNKDYLEMVGINRISIKKEVTDKKGKKMVKKDPIDFITEQGGSCSLKSFEKEFPDLGIPRGVSLSGNQLILEGDDK